MASEIKPLTVSSVPRFPAPIDTSKIKRAPPPPTMIELLETAARAPVEEDVAIGKGLGDKAIAAVAVDAVVKPRKAAVAKPTIYDADEEKKVAAPRKKLTAAPVAMEAIPPNKVIDALSNELEKEITKDRILVKSAEYMPVTRRGFNQFILQAYRRYKLPKLPDIPDPDACAKAVSSSEVKSFAYQAFVRDYIQRASPYRGVLVYHGLGSGKTCTSIAAMEALYVANPDKPVYVMTPASLSPNYKGEIMKCGPFIFRTDNFWRWVPVPSMATMTPEINLLVNVLGVPAFVVKTQKGGWVPDPSRKSNFESLSGVQQAAIKKQIQEHIEMRFEFIHYNGITDKKMRMWACKTPNMFDGATIVIDEVHNLVRTINNASLDVFYRDEPRDMATYIPKFCEVGKKYKIMYLLYRMLCNSVGTKIIALSATPIINFPQEIAILSNILAGDTRMAEVSTPGLDRREQILRMLKTHPEVDFCEVVPRTDLGTSTVRFTPVPSGFRKVIDPATGETRGFVRDERLAAAKEEILRERNLEAWFTGVAERISAEGIAFGKPTFSSVPRLPDLEKLFRELYIDTERFEVKDAMKLNMMARLSGLISYYKGGKADLMAKVTRDEEVYVDMSDLQLKKYTEQRKMEIDKELREKKKKPKAGPDYAQVTQSINSTFKIFSRAACNFVFPADMERPVPADYRDVMKMVGARPGQIGDEPMIDEVADDGAMKIVDATAPITDEEIMEADVPAALENGNTVVSYELALAKAVRELRSRAAEFFSKETLPMHSPKFQAILDRLLESNGPALFYSTFKTLEGVGLFGLAMETQQNYVKFDIVPSGGSWAIAPETLAAGPGRNRYITYTGDEDRAKRNILLAIFNGKWRSMPAALATQVQELTGASNNQKGEIAKVFMITQSGAEGISLANVRQVHIMEPYWNYVRLDQVKGRAIRICSHMDLPVEERTVDVFTYISKFAESQLKDRKVDETLLNFDGSKTTDQTILEILNVKKKLADSIMDVMKKSAVDCSLNATENGGYSCYIYDKLSTDYLFHPVAEIDAASSAEVRAIKE